MMAVRILSTAAIIMSLIISCSYAINRPSEITVKELYDYPGSAKIVYSIPIEVRMLEVSDDANWYKVYLKFNLGPLEFKHTGWAYIPVGEILAERSSAKLAIAATE